MLALTPSALSVLGDEGREVGGGADGGETDEPKGDGVCLGIPGSILGQETEDGNDPTAVTETGLECCTNAAPQVPTNCRKVRQMMVVELVEGIDLDSRLVPSQQIIIEAAEC